MDNDKVKKILDEMDNILDIINDEDSKNPNHKDRVKETIKRLDTLKSQLQEHKTKKELLLG